MREVEEAVLAIRLRALGDVVLTTAALRALRRGHPDARLEVVTDPRYAPLLEGVAGIDRVWPLARTASATAALARTLRRRRWRIAVDFFGNPRSAFLASASGAPRRAGYDLRGRRHAYHVTVPRALEPAPGRREYAAAGHVRLAVAAGGVAAGLETEVARPEAARTAAAERLAAAGVTAPRATVGLVAAGTWATKTWPVSHAAAFARAWTAAGRALLLLAGPGEERVTAAMRRLVPGLLVLPPCDALVLASVVASLAAVVGNDSGPRHLAAACGVPTVGWFGPTHPDTWTAPGPQHAVWRTSVPCRACDRTACPHWNCLPELAPQHAVRLVQAHLGSLPGGA